MCFSVVRFTNVSIFNKTNPVMFEAAICQCAFPIQKQCLFWDSFQSPWWDWHLLSVAGTSSSQESPIVCPIHAPLRVSVSVWSLQPLPPAWAHQTPLRWEGRGQILLGAGHLSCEEHIWIACAGCPGKWWDLAAGVGLPPRDEALGLRDGTSGELHTITCFLPLC